METAKSKLQVLFDPPFWVGVFQREREGRLEACRVVFGAEPRDVEIYGFVLSRYGQLEFSPAVEAELLTEREMNPKRAQRLAQREVEPGRIGTKAQQALQLQHEMKKTQRRIRSREERDAEDARRRQLREEKRKKKHRGR